MTTGRINQVTVLNPHAERAQETPQGGRSSSATMRQRDTKGAPSHGHCTLATRGQQHMTDSIAPTEFPRGRSAARVMGREATTLRCMRPPSGGGPQKINTPKSGYPLGPAPKNPACKR